MDDIIVYLVLTAALGLLQVRDNYLAYMAKRRPQSIDWAFTLLEACWVFVSIAVVLMAELSFYELVVPLLYIAINVSGWIAGQRLMNTKDGKPICLTSIPDSYIISAMVACGLLAAYTIYVLSLSIPVRNVTPILDYLSSNFTVIFWLVAALVMMKTLTFGTIRYGKNLLESDVAYSIRDNKECRKYFGRVISAEIDHEISSLNDKDIMAYYVIGEKDQGLLVAHFVTTHEDHGFIAHGIIQTDENELIELNTVSLQA